MTLPRTVSEVVAEHVVFQVECIDRMYLNVYVPQLQYAAGLVGYVRRQLGLPIASTAPLARITDAFGAAMRRFAGDQQVPWVDFVKGQRKDDVMHEHLAPFQAAGHTEGVLFVGRAQEKTALFRTEKRRDAEGKTYPWIVKTTGLVNHFYVYAVDADFGPFFLKFCSYFPYNARLCLNGHEWAKRQATRAGIGHTALDNAFAAVDDVAAVQAICDSLGPERIDALLRKWLALAAAPVHGRGPRRRLPLRHLDPAGRVLPHPDAGPAGVRPDLLRAGHPGQPRHRPAGPGRAGLRPPPDAHRPARHPRTVPHPCDHRRRHPEPARRLQARHDQAVPQGRAGAAHRDHHQRHPRLRDRQTADQPARTARQSASPPTDVCSASERLSHDPARGQQVFSAVNDPIITAEGNRIAGLRFADPRAHALLCALLVFRLGPNGFTNRDLRALVAQLLGKDLHTLSPPGSSPTTCADYAPTG